nr:hypothetical protein [Ardenticatenales bacterium]
ERVLTVGTSGAIRQVVDQPSLDPEERTWCYLLTEGRWLAGGAINNGGIAVQWARERFYPDLSEADGYVRLLADAATIEPGAAGLLFLPYLTGERSPHWDTNAHATLHGLTLAHRREHVARAVLEGVAFCLAEVSTALPQARGGIARLTGQITGMAPWPQLLADVLGHPLAILEAADASAMGAAMLGHWALGHVATLDDFATNASEGTTLSPDSFTHINYQTIQQAFHTLSQRILSA